MTSDRMQRRIERMLDEADEALDRSDWATVRRKAEDVLALDPDNPDALQLLAAAGRRAGGPATQSEEPAAEPRPVSGGSLSPEDRPVPHSPVIPQAPSPVAPIPAFFANNRYTVKRFLGEGGKKRVFLAHDTTLARDVAFALIKTDGLDLDGRERITREAQAMGRLGTHPHVVSVFDMGSEGESPYLVTELMQGGDVEGLLEKAPDHRLAVPDAVTLAIQVCRGLEFAHSHGLVHRDLKPGNVWLTADGTPKIGDFGLAVSLDRSRLTRAGMMVGTVSYMPPEQAMGGEVSPRSDLYSLGAMLYEMVTGRPPFVGEESVAIITQHLNVPPVSPTWHRPDCPPGLEALILRLLEKDAGKRPASAAEVRQALEALDRGPSIAESQQAGAFTDTTPAAQANDNPLYRRTFVGREQELRQLQATFDGAVSGNGALMMVVGEPGIGKTALCEQLATYVTVRAGKALVGHCYEEGSLSLPYLPFVEALRSYILAREPDALRTELGSGATDVARIVSEVRDRIQVEPRPSGDPEDDRWRLYQSLTGFLRNASGVQPLLIILEDLHWADRGTLDLLVHLSRNLQGARLLIVGTYRDVEVDRTHPLSPALAELRRGSNFGRVALRGLTPDEVQRMLTNLTGQEMRWSLAEAVHRQTEGSPLFIQEVLRYMVEEGMIARDDGRWRRTGNLPLEMGIPEGLRDVIGKRLSRLSPECNRILSVAAVIGRDFRLEVLQQVGRLTEEETIAALEDAKRAGVVEEQTAPGTGVQFRFGHAFFRQTLYEEIFAPRRIRLHQQVGRALEQVYARRVEEHAAELAEHFAQSTEPEDLAKALHYSEVAARRAFAVYAYGESARLLERALQVQEVLDPDDRARCCDLLISLGEVLQTAGSALRVIEEIAPQAFTLAESLGDGDRAAAACVTALLAYNRYGGGGPGGVTPDYREWSHRIGKYVRPGTEAAYHAANSASVVLRSDGRWRAARTEELRSVALATGNPDMFYRATTTTVPPAEERDLLVHLRDLQTNRPPAGISARSLNTFLFSLGRTSLAHGLRSDAEAAWGELYQVAERSRDLGAIARAQLARMILATIDGRLEQAVELGDQIIQESLELGNPLYARRSATDTMLRPRLWLGRGAELGDIESEVLPGQRLLLLAHLWPPDRVRPLLLQTVDGLRQEMDALPTGILVNLLETAVALHEQETCAELVPLLLPAVHIQAVGNRGAGAAVCVARVLGDSEALLGHSERAETDYRTALEECAKTGFRLEIALSHLGLAELLLTRPDRRPEATAHLDAAIAEFGEMKMQPSLERALKHKGLLHA